MGRVGLISENMGAGSKLMTSREEMTKMSTGHEVLDRIDARGCVFISKPVLV